MKFHFAEETASIYWLDDGALMFAPMQVNDVFDTGEGGEVDESLVGDELTVTGRTLNELYKEVKEILA